MLTDKTKPFMKYVPLTALFTVYYVSLHGGIIMLKVNNLTKEYSGNRGVRELNFAIRDKEVVGLIGPNGAGKSTTMRMLCGSLIPTSGKINIWGDSMSDNPLKARMHIGYLPEIPPLYIDLTVREHLEFVCELHGIRGNSKKIQIDRVCQALSIKDVSNRVISHLSKGYRQRVGFASAIIGQPKLLILDEPTVGLDPRQIFEVRELIHELSKQMSILISSHVLSEIEDVCKRLIIINQGKIIADGTIEELTASNQLHTIVTLSGDLAEAERILAEIVGIENIIKVKQQDNINTFELLTKNDPRSAVFESVAKAGNLILLEMYTKKRTLEEAFINAIGCDKT